MSRGTKRFAESSSALDSSDASLESKRVMAASPFAHKADVPKLDAQRAQLCHLHVRALNNQYASWVQSQLENHPDELWEDGALNYINHASHIMEKFSDVVAWLRANAPESDGVSTAALSGDSQKKLVDGAQSSVFKSCAETQVFFPPVASVSATSTFFGTVKTSDSQLPSFSASRAGKEESWHAPAILIYFNYINKRGPQGALPKVEPAKDSGEDDEEEKPSSPSLKRTEEKGIIVVYEVKCKIYMQAEDPAQKGWKDFGMGQLSIKCKEGATKATKESKPTILVRNDVGKILLNALIYPGIKTNVQKNTITAIFHTVGGDGEGSKPRTFLLKAKTAEEAEKLAEAIKEYAPAS
ncbi:pleckstrin homology (PH) domain superfamily protein isoform X2 [Wolffia australiana]